MTRYAYLFEARGIQRFLFASGRLRDMLGGSELLDYLCADGGLLDRTLEKLELEPQVVRKAGAVFYLLFNSRAEAARLCAAWRLACASWLPGIEFTDVISEGTNAREAMAAGREGLRLARNRLHTELPCPGPLIERSPRTGLAAVARDGDESVDAATRRQRSFQRPDDKLLTRRFLDTDEYLWPVNFEHDGPAAERFPLGERRLVGLLHADGNGMGELLRVLDDACREADDDTYVRLYRSFSEGLSEATVAAAQAASETLLPHAVGKVLPARPLVLGGDDLSILLRADLALPFAREFLQAFERNSRISMGKLHAEFEKAGLHDAAARLPESMSACAGLCYMKCSQPFLAAHSLAEGLCGRAKRESRAHRKASAPMPSTLALHRVTDSLLEDAEAQFHSEHCVQHPADSADAAGPVQWQMALPAYAIDTGTGLPGLDDLEELVTVFASGRDDGSRNRLNDRPLRELATLMHGKLALASQAYERWRELADKDAPAELARFDRQLEKLIGRPRTGLPFSRAASPQTPLADLLTLLTVAEARAASEEERIA